jgi:DNA polymerase III subunit chi
MTSVAFYHLQKWPLDRALPKLLEKTIETGNRAVVMAGSDERVEALNTLLWTYENESWLPHGSRKDGAPEDHPVWLTINDENPNQSQFLFLTDGASSDHVGEFERCFELFDGEDDTAVTAAREHWKTYKDAGYDLTYWQQTDRGGWEEKAGS